MSTAPYAELRDELAEAIRCGSLPVGARLTPVRQLAGERGLAPNTVARAYRELEAAGLIDTRGRAGSFVSGDDVNQRLRAAAHAYAVVAQGLGASTEHALDAVRAVWAGAAAPASESTSTIGSDLG